VYSPKIKEELIPILYQMAKAKKTRMTTLVNEIIQKGLDEMGSADGCPEPVCQCSQVRDSAVEREDGVPMR
jgi:hypothetical protein